jgi:hypothetical protein
MQKQNLRVIVASEQRQARDLLKQVVQQEEGTSLVGQAQDVTKTLTLARNLRPHAAIIDCYLPYSVGPDTDRLSRIGGLDVAQTITEEIPNTRVILLGNLDEKASPELSLGPNAVTFFSRDTIGANAPFTLQGLYHEAVQPSSLIFANVEVKQTAGLTQKVAKTSDKAIFFGGLTILGGLALMLTIALAGAGFLLGVAGAATMLLGLTGKLAASLWSRALHKESV